MQVLIEFGKKPLLFDHPQAIIETHKLSEVKTCFEKIEDFLARGYYLAGYISYEAGYAFEDKLQNKDQFNFPLIMFGAYLSPNDQQLMTNDQRPTANDLKIAGYNLTQNQYFANIRAIKDHIAAGETYQITFCTKLKFGFSGNAFALYKRLLRRQPVPYPAFIKTNDFSILSLSPELFMQKTGSFIATKPMKGTWPRGKNWWSNLWAGRKLHYDSKNRAENIMICDLLRNDLGRIGKVVRAPKLFEVARYATLYQMTSTVTAQINPTILIYDLFAALHPSGSVTGAPKIRSMQIIRQLEKEERKIYTGAIGYIAPNKDLFFNVPIRTLLIKDKQGEMGVGGGIVWDSTAEGEWEECQIKACFLV